MQAQPDPFLLLLHMLQVAWQCHLLCRLMHLRKGGGKIFKTNATSESDQLENRTKQIPGMHKIQKENNENNH